MTDPVGDRFRELILCHLDLVYRLAFKLCGNSHQAEDLVQETFLRAHRGFDSFELREYGAKPWLLKILHNAYFNSRHDAARSPTLLADLGLDDFPSDLGAEISALTPEVMSWEGFDEELKRAVERLAPEYRAVMLLWALGDLSYKEIAQVLDCAIGTVMSRLHRARQQLNEQLAEYAMRRGLGRSSEVEP
jgi:RNA polymerase sigma-70 factor (ECF subfamily)